jgi:predicted Rossmann-fold nucleotide-binding protein
VEGFYRPLLGFMDQATQAGFLAAETRAQLHHAAMPDHLLDILERQIS